MTTGQEKLDFQTYLEESGIQDVWVTVLKGLYEMNTAEHRSITGPTQVKVMLGQAADQQLEARIRELERANATLQTRLQSLQTSRALETQLLYDHEFY
eukprot:SAG31_NODE_677_length_12894_cov_4.083548_3_plen_98_part_00